MKILLTLAILLTTSLSHATGASSDIRTPVAYAIVSGTMTTSAWTELTSSTAKAASAIIASNTTASFLILARGASGSEVSTGLIIPPREVGALIPIEIKKGERLSLKAIFSNATGITGLTLFQ